MVWQACPCSRNFSQGRLASLSFTKPVRSYHWSTFTVPNRHLLPFLSATFSTKCKSSGAFHLTDDDVIYMHSNSAEAMYYDTYSYFDYIKGSQPPTKCILHRRSRKSAQCQNRSCDKDENRFYDRSILF